MTGYRRISRSAIGAMALCALFGPAAVPGSGPRLLGPSTAWGQIIVVDHQPHPFAGLGSDTLFVGPSGQPVWQRVADDFTLNADYEIGTIKWWGFYNADNPPAVETMRIRFYGARPGDGLPDDNNMLYETSVQDHTRTWTGRIVATGIGPREYLFQTVLPTPVFLEGGTKFWMEIVQIGDLSTHFRWESSTANLNGHAFMNSITNEWRSTLPGGTADTAFQLITIPEPGSLWLLCLGFAALFARRGKRGCRG